METIALLPLKTTTKCMVKLGPEGVHLHSPYGAPVHKLQFHELVTLLVLQSGDYTDATEVASVVSTRTGTPGADIERFVRILVRHGRVRRLRRAILGYYREDLSLVPPPSTRGGGDLPSPDAIP